MNNYFKAFFFQNYFVALCASAWLFSTFYFSNQHLLSSSSYKVVFLFLSTLFIYNLDRLLADNWKELVNCLSITKLKHPGFHKFHAKVLFLIVLILLCLPIIFQLSFATILQLLPVSVLAIFYAAPILPGGLRLREVSFVKIFLIAFVWAYVVTFLVYSLEYRAAWLLFTERFFFILAITIPFDLRDSQIDRENQLKTLPHILGVKPSLLLAILFLSIGTFMSFYNPLSSFIAVLVSSIIALLLIIFWRNHLSWKYYLLGLDGTILIQALGTILLSVLKL